MGLGPQHKEELCLLHDREKENPSAWAEEFADLLVGKWELPPGAFCFLSEGR